MGRNTVKPHQNPLVVTAVGKLKMLAVPCVFVFEVSVCIVLRFIIVLIDDIVMREINGFPSLAANLTVALEIIGDVVIVISGRADLFSLGFTLGIYGTLIGRTRDINITPVESPIIVQKNLCPHIQTASLVNSFLMYYYIA
jgi:hypothetical protein